MVCKITVKGLDELSRRIDKVSEIEIEKQSDRIANKLVSELAAATPKDSGTASRGWRYRKTPFGNSIINEVPYISKLNSGSSRQAPQHFIENTIIQSGDVKPSGLIVEKKRK